LKYLLDTNVLSAMRRRGRHPAVTAWFRSVVAADLFMSVLTLGEVRKGIEEARGADPAFAQDLETWLQELEREFLERIVPIDQDIAEAWGRMLAVDDRAPVDALLAATALVHGMALVTRNTKDFRARGVPVIDPFQPARH